MPATGAAATEPDNNAAVDPVIVAPGMINPLGSVVLKEGTSLPLVTNTEFAAPAIGDTD